MGAVPTEEGLDRRGRKGAMMEDVFEASRPESRFGAPRRQRAPRRRGRLAGVISAAALAVPLVTIGGALPASAATPSNLSSYSVTDTIGGVPGATAVAVDSATDTIYVTNRYNGTVTVIDGATNKVTGTIPVGSGPFAVAVDPVTDTVYVANDFYNTVSVIDGATNKVTATIAVGANPTGVAVDPLTDTVYVVNTADGTMSVIDGATNSVTDTVNVGGAYTLVEEVAVDPATDTIYTGDLQGTLLKIDGATNDVTVGVSTPGAATAVAVDPATNTVYVPNAYDGALLAYNGASLQVTATTATSLSYSQGAGTQLAVDPTTNTIYSLNIFNNTASVVNGATNTVTATLGVGSNPSGVALDATTGIAYVANQGSGTVSVITPPVAARLADLYQAVQGVGPGASLSKDVSKAQSYFASGDVARACRTLGSFVKKVQAQSGKRISPTVAGGLVVDAQGIEATLSC